MMKNIFDSHAHYDDESFNSDRDELLCSLSSNGVSYIITCGCDLESSIKSKELAEQYEFIYFAAGFHPENLEGSSLSDLEKIKELAKSEKCVAIGEIGLDYHWMASPKETQKKFFKEQIKLAQELSLPVIVHDREAHADTYEILGDMKPNGVLHCFSGSANDAKRLVEQGMYIGFNGIVTFKNARKSIEAAKAIPLDRILLETDCPYCAPVPHRGKRNDSSYIPFIAERLSQELNIPAQKILDITKENAMRLFLKDRN